MKKTFFIILAALLLPLGAYAGTNEGFGLLGGFTSMTARGDGAIKDNIASFHAGLTYKISLPAGFAVQPSILYQKKCANFESSVFESSKSGSTSTVLNYIEIPVGIQWGPDLFLFRPYVEVAPFIGFGISNRIGYSSSYYNNAWDNFSKLEYGMGAGAGVEIWRFQISAHYVWNINSLSTVIDDAKMGGWMASVAFFF